MKTFFRTISVSISVVLLALFTLAACTESETSEPTGSGPTDSLVIYTYDAFPESLEQIVVTHFEEEYGFAPQLERFQDTGGLYNQAFLERDDPGADVILGLDNTYVGRAIEEELFQAYEPAGADQLREELILDPAFRLTPFDWGHIVLNYDSEQLPDPPRSWEELLDPRLENSIIVMNPATSSPGRNFLLLTVDVFGEDGYLEFWRQLEPNLLTITSGWSEGYGLYTQGEAPIVLSYESSPAYHIEFEDTDRYRNLILDGVGYAQVEVAGITSGAQNLTNAQRFMDFILTDAFQESVPLSQFMYPVFDTVTLPESFQAVEKADRTVRLGVETVDENFPRWLEKWEAEMR